MGAQEHGFRENRNPEKIPAWYYRTWFNSFWTTCCSHPSLISQKSMVEATRPCTTSHCTCVFFRISHCVMLHLFPHSSSYVQAADLSLPLNCSSSDANPKVFARHKRAGYQRTVFQVVVLVQIVHRNCKTSADNLAASSVFEHGAIQTKSRTQANQPSKIALSVWAPYSGTLWRRRGWKGLPSNPSCWSKNPLSTGNWGNKEKKFQDATVQLLNRSTK